MKTALFAGSFDPPTHGHMDIVRKARGLFDRLIIGIADNSAKKTAIFTADERISLLKSLTSACDGVEVVSFSGLVVDYAKKRKIDFLVRGIRTSGDLSHELSMAHMNHQMTGIDTVLLLADASHAFISATLVREVATSGRDLKDFVPEAIASLVSQKLRK